MTLDDFFRECKQKGATPLSYKEFTESINGTKTVEYENPTYRKAKEVIARVLNRGRGNSNDGNSGIDGLVSNLYGEDVIRTLYRLKRAWKRPMTEILEEIIQSSLRAVDKEAVCRICIDEGNNQCEECCLK